MIRVGLKKNYFLNLFCWANIIDHENIYTNYSFPKESYIYGGLTINFESVINNLKKPFFDTLKHIYDKRNNYENFDYPEQARIQQLISENNQRRRPHEWNKKVCPNYDLFLWEINECYMLDLDDIAHKSCNCLLFWKKCLLVIKIVTIFQKMKFYPQ